MSELIEEASSIITTDKSSKVLGELLKKYYDRLKSEEDKCSKKSNTLPELLMKGFDNEQIWQQLSLQISENQNHINKVLPSLLPSLTNEVVQEDNRNEVDDTENGNNTEESEENEDEESVENEEEFDENVENEEEFDESEAQINEDVDFSDKNEEVESKDHDSEEYDQEIEDFLNDEYKEKDENKDSDDEEEEEIDYFAEDLGGDEDDDGRMAKFNDFFKPMQEEKKECRNKFAEELSEDEEKHLSNFELRQGRLQKNIEAIENNAISEKHWTMKGEIKADGRPINSLLEEVVKFDRTSRPAPIVTGKTTLKLEDIIKQRIKDRAFDDVERKVRVVDEPFEFKKKLTINQEKSKESLAQIYEKEYLDKQAALDPENSQKEEESKEYEKIKQEMDILFDKLDKLSNNHFTPKRVIPELKIVSNKPALLTEEVGPLAISEVSILPPEKITGKPKGDVLGQTERTSTDKKRERRKKKAKQKFHANLQAAKLTQVKKTEKVNKKNEEQIIKLLTKDANTKKMEASTKLGKSSKAFFQQIEEKQNMKAGDKGKKRKADETKFNAKKLKL